MTGSASVARVLRGATAADVVPVLVAIDVQCRPKPWSAPTFERELQNEVSRVSVLEVDGVPAGFVVAWWVLDDVEIQNICVAPQNRRCGHAGWMLDEVIRGARVAAVSSLRLEVRASNSAAIALYLGRGFREQGRRRGYYSDNGEDAILLGFTLEPLASEC